MAKKVINRSDIDKLISEEEDVNEEEMFPYDYNYEDDNYLDDYFYEEKEDTSKELKEINNNLNQVKKSNKLEENKIYLKYFIGNNFDKIVTRKLNFSALVFGECYLLYRKKYFLGFILLAIRISLLIFLPKYAYISLLINIISFIVFNSLYLNYANRKVDAIKKKSSNHTYERMYRLCEEKGGTNKLLFLLVLLVIIIICIIKYVNIPSIDIGNVFNKNDKNVNPEYNGILYYNQNNDAKTKFSIKVPSEFKDTTSTYHMSGSIINNSETACEYTFGSIKYYKDAKDLSNQLKKYLEEVLKTNGKVISEERKINGLKWYYVEVSSNEYTNTYALTEYNDNVYLYNYVINDVETSCAKYKESIINSIRKK